MKAPRPLLLLTSSLLTFIASAQPPTAKKIKSIKEETYEAIQKDSIVSKSTLKHIEYRFFDTQGNLLEEKLDIAGDWGYRMLYQYDSLGKLVEKKTFDGSGNFQSKQLFFYAEQKLVKELHHDEDDSLERRIEYRYNDKGNVSEKKKYTEEDLLFTTETFTYDAEGRMVEWNEILGNNITHKRCLYQYDSKGNRTKTNCSDAKDNKWESVTNYQYDDKGNETEYEHYYSASKEREFKRQKYEYNEQNKWKRKITYNRLYAIEVTERVVEFY